MEVTHLGHESWLIKSKTTKLLIDPILGDTFGTNSELQFSLIPNRTIDRDLLKDIDVIIYTTEYFQHFDLKSLAKIESKPKIIISNLFTNESALTLRNMGYTVQISATCELLEIGDLQMIYIPPHSDSIIWDSRVCSVALSLTEEREDRDWIFFQSDTMINDQISELIYKDWNPLPLAVFLTNHIKFWDSYGYSASDNFLENDALNISPVEYIDLISTIIPTGLPPLNLACTYILCGGGYDNSRETKPTPNIDNQTILRDLKPFLLNAYILAPRPGDIITLNKELGPSVSKSKHIQDLREKKKPLKKPYVITPNFKESHINEFETELLISSLEYLQKALLFSSMGEALIFNTKHLNKPCSSKRFCLQLLSSLTPKQFYFDFSSGSFKEEDFNGQEALLQYPMGIQLFLSDYLNVLKGKTTIVEVCHSSCIQWYSDGYSNSPLGFLYTAFAEFMPNGIAKTKYHYVQEHIKKDNSL